MNEGGKAGGGMSGKAGIEEFYKSDRFMEQNFAIEVDSPWKVEKISPFLELFAKQVDDKDITVMDVGGGSGIILKSVAEIFTERHGRKVRQLALDLSPGYLEVQKKNNPGIEATYHGSIESTPLGDREVDLVLLMDVLEHVHDTEAAYRELGRIARYVLLKVPLEKNMSVDLLEMVSGYRTKRAGEEGVGHINFYTFDGLIAELEAKLGSVEMADYTDVFTYLLNSRERRKGLSFTRVVYCRLAQMLFRVSPKLAARIFNDFAIMLVKCY